MIMMPFWVLWEAAGLCKNASMTFLQKRSVLEVGEESLAALKGAFSFQRDFILEGNAAGYQSSLSSNESEIKGLSQGPQPHTWGLCYTHLAVLTYLSRYGSRQGMRKSLTKRKDLVDCPGVCSSLIVREKPAERQVIIRFWGSWPYSVCSSQQIHPQLSCSQWHPT